VYRTEGQNEATQRVVKDVMKELNGHKVNQLYQGLGRECWYRSHLGPELWRLGSQKRRGMGDIDIHLEDANGLCRARLRRQFHAARLFLHDLPPGIVFLN